VKTELAVVQTRKTPAVQSSKVSLYHAHLDFDGTCKGYERHMRRGSAVRSVYGYLAAILKKHPNPLNYVFPSKRRIQRCTYKWIRVNRKKWVMTDENYSRRQIYSALRTLTEISAILPSQNGWIIRSHEIWTEKVMGVCRVRALADVPVLPSKARTRVTVLEHAIQRKGPS